MIHRDTDMFRRAVTVALVFSLVLGLCSCTQSKPRPQSLITDVVETKDNTYECQFKDKKFRFMLYLPEKTDSNTPLILMLCGMGQNSPGFRNWNRFHNSVRLFCRGVPLRASLPDALRLIAACDAIVLRFFIWCASSRQTTFHFLPDNRLL